MDKNTTNSKKYFWIIIMTGVIMLIIVSIIYIKVVGLGNTASKIIFGAIIAIISINTIISAFDPIGDFNDELSVYSYIESNARIFIGFGLVMAAFILALDKDFTPENTHFKNTLIMITACFILSLVIIWAPRSSGIWIRILRDIKNAILTLGTLSVIIFLIIFLA